MKQRRAAGSPGRSVADLFPESMRKFGLAGIYGNCEASGCARRARTTCPRCGGELCYAHATDPDHDGGPQPSDELGDGPAQ